MYHIELVKSDAELIVRAVNQGIDAHLHAVTDSTFEAKGNRLVCNIAPNDLGVIVRRLLETEDEQSETLAGDICYMLGIEEIWLTIDDRFQMTHTEDSVSESVSVFDLQFWADLMAVNEIA